MPNINSMHAVLHGGVGIVARWKEVVLVIPANPNHNQAAQSLIRGLKPDASLNTVVSQVHELVVKQRKLQAVAMLVDRSGGIGMMAFGDMEILHDGEVALVGRDVPETKLIEAQKLDRLDSVTVQYAGSPEATKLAGPYDLRHGSAPGAGVTLSRNREILSAAALPDRSNPQAQPPGPGPGERRRRQVSGGTVVGGVLCGANHFNDPRSTYCTTCGASIPPGSPLTNNYRPSLGYLVFEDGTPYMLDRSYYIGREPRANGTNAETIIIPDEQEILSRTHAVVELVDWDVRLRDHNSTNGTFIWDTVQNRWAKLSPGEPVVLSPGTKIMMGRRTFTYDLHPEMSN